MIREMSFLLLGALGYAEILVSLLVAGLFAAAVVKTDPAVRAAFVRSFTSVEKFWMIVLPILNLVVYGGAHLLGHSIVGVTLHGNLFVGLVFIAWLLISGVPAGCAKLREVDNHGSPEVVNESLRLYAEAMAASKAADDMPDDA
ncbi:hypothetical protein [Burkholderia gladioli]|uniref:hypothetical protein n=1 Tax=Burkholderia gladioli TaxID=28095 RepID=UPI00163F883A|nr:hypothetical protein [Burkholderia gladioli]